MTTFEIVKEFIEVEKEDDLTKAVFGCLELLSTSALNEIFEQASLDMRVESAPDFTFHETVDRREPDVIIEDGQSLTVMVEAKLGSPTNMTQLSDEYADLIEGWNSDTLRLLHVTDDGRQPPEIEARTRIPSEHFQWTSWRRLAAALLKVDTTVVNRTDRRVIAMLTQIFEDEGFAPFGGFTIMNESQTLSNQLQQAYQVRNQYYDEINSFRKDVEKNLTDEVRYWRFFRRGVSGGMGRGQISFPTSNYQRMPKHLWFTYVPQDQKPTLAHQNYLQNYLLLDFNSRTGAIRAGYTATTAPGKVKNDLFRKTLHEQKEMILKIISEHGFQPYTTSYSLDNKIESIDELDSFFEEIGNPSHDISEWGKRFLLTRTWSAEELPTRDEEAEMFRPAHVTKDVASALNEIHQLTYHDHDRLFYPEVE